MRNSPNCKANRYRVRSGSLASSDADGNNGCFVLARKGMPDLVVVVSDGGGWDHVSVSTEHRCPDWEEMCLVKELFFRDDEAAYQLHPAKATYVNNHPYALHLWRPQRAEIPLPPPAMVGLVGVGPDEARRAGGPVDRYLAGHLLGSLPWEVYPDVVPDAPPQ